MSFSATRWAWDQTISAGAKYVLLALADYADEEGFCFPSQKTLAQKCGLARSTINLHLQTLVRAGLMTIQDRRHPSGRRSASLYRLLLDQSPNIQRRDFDKQGLKSGHDPVRNPDSLTNQLTYHKNLMCPESGLSKSRYNKSTKQALKDAL